jgi:SAM-dependent methyltransferase
MSIANRLYWDVWSKAYQATHGELLAEKPLAWGVWRIPESEVNALGRVEGRAVLELGCGAAQWTAALRQLGARAVGVDLSQQQLEAARAYLRSVGASAPLVHGDAEKLPFRSDSFDTVFCDHGATVFAAPEPTVAEASRVLRPGGLVAFCMSTPVRDLCIDPANGRISSALVTDYFDMRAIEDGEAVNYQLPYGTWIRLFRQHSLVVEDLVELQAPAHATTTYEDFVPLEWARRWPAEHVWKLRKVG